MEFKKLTKTIQINGKTVKAEVTIHVAEEQYIRIQDDYASGDAEQDKKYFARFESGELFLAQISVEARALGETGVDALGACHIHSNNFFNSKPFNDDVEQIVNDHDMIANALNDLADTIKRRANQLKEYA